MTAKILKVQKRQLCRWCGVNLYSDRHERHEDGKWLRGADAIRGTWYGKYGFCCEGCWANFVSRKMLLEEIQL